MTAPSNSAKPPSWAEWKARTVRRWWGYPLAVEWALEWFVYRLRGLALFELLELAGKLTVLVAVVVWFLEADQRARQAEEAVKERHYRAWELINAAAGKAGDGGRRDALQDLNKDGVNLAAAPLEKAYLPEVDLAGANLLRANLAGADLEGANLAGANLLRANLAGANLVRANLKEARLWGANLASADLEGANLASALLMGANLASANLVRANLAGAHLGRAEVRPPPVWRGEEREDLTRVMLQGAQLTQAQLDAADGDDRTILPEGMSRPAHWSKSETEAQPGR